MDNSTVQHFHFADFRELFAKANEEKSGDQLAGIAASSERERVAAKCALADLPLSEIVRNPMIDPRDGTRIVLVRSSEGRGYYRVPVGRYGVHPGELLLLECGTGRVIGVVKP